MSRGCFDVRVVNRYFPDIRVEPKSLVYGVVYYLTFYFRRLKSPTPYPVLDTTIITLSTI